MTTTRFGRTVTVFPVESPCLCADCGRSAVEIIVEADGSTWFYCGVCEIG